MLSAPSAYVIHAVGPIYDPDETEHVEEQLQSCYKNSLNLAVENSVGSIVRPASVLASPPVHQQCNSTPYPLSN